MSTDTNGPPAARPSPAAHAARCLAVLAVAAVAVAAGVVGGLLYSQHASVPFTRLAEVELGGRGGLGHTLHAMHPGGGVPMGVFVDQLHQTLRWDWALIVGGGLALLLGNGLNLWLLSPTVHRTRALVGVLAAVVVVVAGAATNLVLVVALDGHDVALSVTAVLAVLKFCVLLPAAVGALAGIGSGIVRAVASLVEKAPGAEITGWHAVPVLPDDPVGPAAAWSDDGAATRWRRGYLNQCCPDEAVPAADANNDVVGIGLSGGGIRAATLALGALQSSQLRPFVQGADYLVSVSGGGYTAGAFVQLLTSGDSPPAGAEDEDTADVGCVIRDASTAYAPGTPEEDHLRRHASYLADSPAGLGRALVLLGRHLLLSLTLLFGPAVVLGFLIGDFYAHVPVTVLTLPTGTTRTHTVGLSFRPTAWAALGIVALLAVLVWLAAQGVARPPDRTKPTGSATRRAGWHRDLATFSQALNGVAVLLGIVVVVLPGITWVSSSLLDASPNSVAAGAPVLGVFVTYGATVASIVKKRKGAPGKLGTLTKALPGTASRLLLVGVSLVALSMLWLMLFGGLVTVGLQPHVDGATYAIIGGFAGAVVVLGLLTDETTLSLHPFYRARIASAFAVRRVRLTSGAVVAEPYPAEVRTSLSRFGVTDGVRFPHVVFAASATLDAQRTPPGANRVSYTMCSHGMGGPEVGYVGSASLENAVSPRLHRDLTVQAAVAISGAAVAASAGGQGSSWSETLLAVSGARLGAWLPNPRFVLSRYARALDLRHPRLPRIRRLPYLLRELFGGHSADLPLLQVTDGGFYDNLGLVELLRRGCTRIVCIDASGDSPPTAETFAAAQRLAFAELGVTIEPGPAAWSSLPPGTGAPLGPDAQFDALNKRMSQCGVVPCTITYPACSPHAGRTGVLVLAKASLWPELPYDVLSYAQGAGAFPHDSTGDQFFDGDRYAAYTQLGRELGDAAAKAMASV